MKTFKIQWRFPNDLLFSGPREVLGWKDINGEIYHLKEHAELRKSSYWDKEFVGLEFRVEEES